MLPGLNLAPTYRIAKNFKGENFHEFRVFVAICESLLREIWGGGGGVLWQGKREQSAKVSPLKVSHYTVHCQYLCISCR